MAFRPQVHHLLVAPGQRITAGLRFGFPLQTEFPLHSPLYYPGYPPGSPGTTNERLRIYHAVRDNRQNHRVARCYPTGFLSRGSAALHRGTAYLFAAGFCSPPRPTMGTLGTVMFRVIANPVSGPTRCRWPARYYRPSQSGIRCRRTSSFVPHS